MASTKKAADHPFENATSLPRMLREWRQMNQVKLSTAANDLGVSTSTWGHWETGARFPKGKKLLKLVTYTGIPLHLLICPSDAKANCQRCEATPTENSLQISDKNGKNHQKTKVKTHSTPGRN